MRQVLNSVGCDTLGEYITRDYSGYEVIGGAADAGMDVSHGVEVETSDNSRYGYGTTVYIYPFVKWSDGSFKPCHYWGSEYYVVLFKR